MPYPSLAGIVGSGSLDRPVAELSTFLLPGTTSEVAPSAFRGTMPGDDG
jgi:hypothetical protein